MACKDKKCSVRDIFLISLILLVVSIIFGTDTNKTETETKVSKTQEVSHKNEKHWGYSGEQGPDKWAELDKKYAMCVDGKNQSPINIVDSVDAKLENLNLSTNDGVADKFINNGHTVQVNFKDGSSFTMNGKVYNLLQFHLHTPSENHIKGKEYPAEIHLVHKSKDGELAVIALMVEEDKRNEIFKDFIKDLPSKTGDNNTVEEEIYGYDIVPRNTDYFYFNGSLTTPPCTEGVRWFVIKEPIKMSKKQIESFQKVMGKNNRPIQEVFSRQVIE